MRTQSAFRQEVSQTTLEHTGSSQFVYDTFNNPVFPLAPYEMSDPEGIGPLISDTPIAILSGASTEAGTERVVGRREFVANSRANLQTEADLFVLGLIPRVRWQVSEQFSLPAEAGGTLSLLDARLRREETFETDAGRVVGQWNDRADEQKWLWGATISLGAQWQLNEQLYLGASGGYDWVETTRLSIGPDRVAYDISGYQLELALGWTFGITR